MIELLIPELKSWFEDYVRGFFSDDPAFQEGVNLKRSHTLRVCDAIMDIGGSLDLPREDLHIAEATALLHDIGRFEQYRKYGTFSDHRSEDHAVLGVKVIRANRERFGFEPDTLEIILRVVGYHNRASLPVDEEERCLFFLRLLRDADKVDIWHVVTDYYRNAASHRNRSIELDLPDIPRISDRVCEDLKHGRLARMTDLKTLNDFKLLQIGWVYDLNFPRTFQIVRERGYLEMIRDTLPKKSLPVEEVYGRARAYLDRNSGL